MSSLQRSGLNISVGDTKSIVLALQALQAKIRTLEQDRDYHQDQYERELQAHEVYKLNMEQQIEHERAEHRRREKELTDMLKRAQQDRAQLEASVGGAPNDLTAFRNELEAMLAAEKSAAQEREARLIAEVEKLRSEIKGERTQHAALLMSIDNLAAEKRITDETNEQLRLAVDELLARQEQQQQLESASPSLQPHHNTSHGNRQQRQPARLQQQPQQQQYPPRQSVPRRRVSRRFPFQDPTCSSILRDVRNVSGEIPCCHPEAVAVDTSVSDARVRPSSRDPRRSRSGGGGNHNTSGRALPSSNAVNNTSGGGAELSANRRGGNSPASRAAPGPNTYPNPSTHMHAYPYGSAGAPSATANNDSVADVEAQLREELSDLEAQYTDAVAKASSGGLSRDVLTAALQRISDMIDDKESQLSLLAKIRQGASAAAASSSSSPAGAASYPSVQRQQLMNELRSL